MALLHSSSLHDSVHPASNGLAGRAFSVKSNRPDWNDVTAIIPAYRCSRYLPAAVESLLMCPLKIIITDDDSGDQTLQVAHDLQTRYPDRITVMHNPTNLGVSRSINRSLEAVRTRFVLKMDADDVVFPEYVRRAFDYIWNADDLALICGTCEAIGPDEYLSLESEPSPQKSLDGKIRVMSGVDACRFILRWNPYPCSSGIIYRTDALKSAGGFATGLNWAEDREVWFRLARRWPVAYYDVPGALYRIHSTSLSAFNRAHHQTAVQDGRLLLNSRRLWPEPELLGDFARAFYQIGRDCRRTSQEALKARSWSHAIRCAGASARYLIHAGALAMRTVSAPGEKWFR
jgi:glycosyltransferase involved in cell wall biosynthesis